MLALVEGWRAEEAHFHEWYAWVRRDSPALDDRWMDDMAAFQAALVTRDIGAAARGSPAAEAGAPLLTDAQQLQQGGAGAVQPHNDGLLSLRRCGGAPRLRDQGSVFACGSAGPRRGRVSAGSGS